MKIKNTPAYWGAVSQLLHWVILLVLVAIAWVGLDMVELPNTPRKINAYALHKSLGLTLLVLVGIRLLWRLYAGAPKPVPGSPAWQERIASLTHVGLYALMLAMPLSGWLFNSAAGYPLQWFKQFNLPALSGRDAALSEIALSIHMYGFWLLVLMVVLHAGAALYHHFIQRDSTLIRMLPVGTGRAPPSSEI